ncbi:MAG: sulfatase-like hydrolase/transferase [Bacteroidales bacterium]|nr:MAG: sulfatase-like hydrolase/transferase [Bacteroidales bacterium]
MKGYFSNLELLVRRLLLVLALFTITRFVFWILNFGHFDSLRVTEIFYLFIVGIRFDIAAILGFNILFIILHLIPGKINLYREYQILLMILFIVVNSLILGSNLVDCEYYKFTNRRTTSDILKYIFISNDLVILLPAFIRDFWYLLLLWIIFTFGLWKFYPRMYKNIRSSKTDTRNLMIQSALSIGLLALVLVGFRGIRLKPLRIIDAAKYTQAKNMSLVLNTPFTLLKSISYQALKPVRYFPPGEMEEIFNPVHQFNQDEEFRPLNVIIIILESMSKEYIGAMTNRRGYTPFLDSLAGESLVFTRAFANGIRSIEAFPAILSALPTLFTNSYISSPYSSNNINSLASVLTGKGYHTSFFHGGNNGTMGFDNFAKIAGIREYYGRNEYGNDNHYDGNWGIFDEEFLQFYADKLNSFHQPFFSTVFTLSSHHPYHIPEKYNELFKEEGLDIYRTLRYADYALMKFFREISKMAWYSNTLFVITADHTSYTENPFYQNRIGKYAVPIIFFHPSDPELKGTSDMITQHCDIFPSVLNYLNYDESFVAFGQSVFDTSCDHFALCYNNGLYQIIMDDHAMTWDGEKGVSLYDIVRDSLLQNNLVNDTIDIRDKTERKIKAVVQSYNQRLIGNVLVPVSDDR